MKYLIFIFYLAGCATAPPVQIDIEKCPKQGEYYGVSYNKATGIYEDGCEMVKLKW